MEVTLTCSRSAFDKVRQCFSPRSLTRRLCTRAYSLTKRAIPAVVLTGPAARLLSIPTPNTNYGDPRCICQFMSVGRLRYVPQSLRHSAHSTRCVFFRLFIESSRSSFERFDFLNGEMCAAGALDSTSEALFNRIMFTVASRCFVADNQSEIEFAQAISPPSALLSQ